MDRVAIMGCSGGGKSTLARSLGARLGLPVVHMDTLFWRPGWVETPLDVFKPLVDAAALGERWIIEGNFTGASALRLARADTIIWLDLPRSVCLWRAFWRMAGAFGRTRGDLAPGCPERIDLAFYRYIWTWNRRTSPRAAMAIATHGTAASFIRLKSDGEIAAFLRSLS